LLSVLAQNMNNTTVIIGAGIAGLLLARGLVARGVEVVVLEKSRGYGGRMATKRVGEASFDSGAQYFTVREPGFATVVNDWQAHGWVQNWPASPHRRLVGTPAMTAVPKALADGLTILREHKVTAARRPSCDYWELEVENHGLLRAKRVLFACPVPQALAVLAAGEFTLPASVAPSLESLHYHPCLALLVSLAGPSAVPAEGLALTDGPVRWLADNVKKGLAQTAPAAVTVHASAEFSAQNYSRPEAEITALLLPGVECWLGAPVVSTTLHRWKFSEPKTTHPERCVWLSELGLGFAGDAFGGPKIEGAAMSALALTEAILPHLQPAR
jgi:predicted NAD/FAD-dependent oxidoreductase